MILAAGILSLLILVFCLLVRRHELVYYYIRTGKVLSSVISTPTSTTFMSSEEKLVFMEPPDGRSYQITCVWRTLFRWKLSHSCSAVSWLSPPRYFNCRSQVVPVMEVVIDHEKELEE